MKKFQELLANLRNAKTQSPIGREIADKMLKDTRRPKTPADFREMDLDRRFFKSHFHLPR